MTRLGPLLLILPVCAAGCRGGLAGQPRHPADTASVVVEFSDAGGLIQVNARVNDSSPRPFILDTGARPCLLDGRVAAALGVVARDSQSLGGAAGKFTAGIASPTPRVRLAQGDLPVPCTEVVLTDLAGVSRSIGARVDGILGGDFFRDRIVVIDYGAHRLEIRPSPGFRYTGLGDTVPITIRRNRPWLIARLTVPGGTPVDRELLIDTGSEDAVDDSLLLRSTEPLSGGHASGLGAGQSIRVGRFSRVSIGRSTFDDVPGVVPVVPIIGSGILRRFRRLIFDYGAGRMYLER